MMTNNKQFIGLILERIFVSGGVAVALIWGISFIPDGNFSGKSVIGFLCAILPFVTICFILLESFVKTRSCRESLKTAAEWLEKSGIISSVPDTKEVFVIEFSQSLALTISYLFLLLKLNFNIIEALFYFSPMLLFSFRNAFLFFFKKKQQVEITSN